jgi:autotransporter-associated beta strand protein
LAKACTAIALPLLLASLTTPAATLTFSPPAYVAADTDVINTSVTGGASLAAYDWSGTYTLNNLTFNLTTATNGPANNYLVMSAFAKANATAFSVNAAPFNTLSSTYSNVLKGATFRTDTAGAGVTLSNLISNNRYLVELWVSDPRLLASNRTETVSSGGAAVSLDYNSTSVDGGVGQYTFATFTADNATQTITLTPNASAQINAIQLQDITAHTPANLNWVGGGGNNWDMNATANFNGGAVFQILDNVTFDDTATTFTPNVASNVIPTSVTFNNTVHNYTLGGNAAILGTGTLTKTGAGQVTITAANNNFGGALALNGGTVSVATVANSGFASPLGAGGSISFNGGTLQFTGASGGTDRNITLNSSGGTFKTDTALTLNGAISGAGGLTKTGAGTVMLTSTETYVGNTTISNGTLSLGSLASLASTNIFLSAKSAVLDVSAAGGYDLANSKIQGNGTVNGALIVDNGGVITVGGATGTSCDVMTNNGDLTIYGTNVVRIYKTGNTNDSIRVIGNLNLVNGCTLEIHNVGGTINAGDQFVLFTTNAAGSITAGAVNLTGFVPTSGWDLSKLGNGILKAANAGVPSLTGPSNTVGQCSATLTASASGAAPLTYLWTLDGSPYATGVDLTSINISLPSSASPHTVTLHVTNSVGSSVTNNASVTIQDTIPPVITVIGDNPMGVIQNSTFVEPGFTATDNCSSSLILTTNITVNTAVTGNYTNTFYADDGNGNRSTNTRVVVVSPTFVWTNLASGSWTNSANWLVGAIPSGTDSPAYFNTLALTANIAVTLDTARTIGRLYFDDLNSTKHSWTISPGSAGPLTLSTSSGAPVISNNVQTTLTAGLAGSQGLTKTGSGLLVLSNNNSSAWSGPVTISTGALQLGTPSAAPNAASTLQLGDANSGSGAVTFQVAAGSSLANPITVSSAANSATLFLDMNPNATAAAVVNNSITLQKDLWITNSSSQLLQLYGQITGAGNVHVATPTYGSRVRLVYNGNNFNGNLYIHSGGLQTGDGNLGTMNVVPDNADVTVYAGATLGISKNDTMGALNGDAGSVVGENSANNGDSATLAIGYNNHDGTFNGNIWLTDVGSPSLRPNMPLQLTKLGSGTQTFNGNCSNTAPTTVIAGTLAVNSGYFASPVTVYNRATLAGNGNIAGSVSILRGGLLSPGTNNAIGTLTINNNLTCAGNMLIHVDKQAAQSNDLVVVSGVLNNTGSGNTLTVSNRNANPAYAFAAGDKFTIFSQAMGNGATLAISPSRPGPGLAWINNLAVDGSISVGNGSSSADLSNLVLTPAGTLSPPYIPSVLNYSAIETFSSTVFTVTPTALDSNANIQVIYGGTTNPVVSGNASAPLTLDPNFLATNTVTVQVISPDTSKTNNYVVNVVRSPSLNPFLLSQWIQPVPRISVLTNTGYYVWGGSVVEDAGQYHMFYSRWPTSNTNGFSGWVTDSEIAHAVATNPAGPFTFTGVVLGKRPNDPGYTNYWDSQTQHNPHIRKFGNKFYLYYMASVDPGVNAWPGQTFLTRVQRNQRIGVVVANSINDLLTTNFVRPNAPIVSPVYSTNAATDLTTNPTDYAANRIVNNETVTQRPDGKYQLIYKSNWPQSPGYGHGYALADDPAGPYTLMTGPMFSDQAREDENHWYDPMSGKYYLIIKNFTGPATEQLVSNDSSNWVTQGIQYGTIVRWNDGTDEVMSSLERPQMLRDSNGVPVMLYMAMRRQSGNSFNVHIPLAPQTVHAFVMNDPSAISTNGTLLSAVNFGATSNMAVNGLTFTASGTSLANLAATYGLIQSGGASGATLAAGSLNSSYQGFPEFEGFLDTAVWQTGTATAGAKLQFTLKNLPVGRTCRLQLFFGETGTGVRHGPQTVDIAGQWPPAFDYGPASMLVATGVTAVKFETTWVATQTNEIVTLSQRVTSGSGLQLAAYALHDVTPSTNSTNAYLAGLAVTPAGTLSPVFASNILSYTTTEAYPNTPVTVTPTTADPNATIQVIFAGATNSVASGSPSAPLPLDPNPLLTNTATVRVVSQDTMNTNDYRVTVVRQPSLARPPLGWSTSGNTLTLSWPLANSGYKLQTQTNPLSTGLNGTWFDVPGSTTTNQIAFPVSPTNPAVFYRLVY